MIKISMSEYVPVINSIEDAEVIYNSIKTALKDGEVVIDFLGIRFISTNCAKHIFGRLVLELGEESFFNSITLSNASDNVKVSVNTGIENAIEEGFA